MQDMQEPPQPDDDDSAYAELRRQVRKALSPVLGMKPYVLVVDASTLDDLKADTENIYIISPEYQRGILTRGLLDTAKEIDAGTWAGVGGGD